MTQRDQLPAILDDLEALYQQPATNLRTQLAAYLAGGPRPMAAAREGGVFAYGTLLCVSDKPLHGEIKLPGQANLFYEQAISQHLMIGIEAIAVLREEGTRLHSRKLRAFDEPPFR